MRTRFAIAGASLAAIVAAIPVVVLLVDEPAPNALPSRSGFYVADGRLYDANNKEFVMRGASQIHTAYPAQTPRAFANMKRLGANTVRVELSTGAVGKRNGAADIRNLISLCRKNRLICVLVAHDTTGWGQRFGAIPQARAVDYWVNVRSALAGQERYAIVNVANEPYGLYNHQTWRTDTMDSVKRLRRAGLHNTLMVDAPDWGQDRSFAMRDNAAAVFANDPERNTVFSVHMYGAFGRAANITNYLTTYVKRKLPVVVSEFGFMHSDGDVDEDKILSEAQAHGIGYIGWSWSGNAGDVAYLDMVTNFNAARITPWGRRIFNGRGGIKPTSHEASVYTT